MKKPKLLQETLRSWFATLDGEEADTLFAVCASAYIHRRYERQSGGYTKLLDGQEVTMDSFHITDENYALFNRYRVAFNISEPRL